MGDFDRAIELAPLEAMARYNRGVAWASLGDLDRADADYSEAIRLDPRQAQALTNRELIRRSRGDLEGVLDDLERAVEAAPKAPVSRANLALALLDAGRAAEALRLAPPGWPPRGQVERLRERSREAGGR